ncbi:hypothetical protein O6H91_05G079300 [Diphasiastrum complanatum]|uniref:Uncharacterized protein n=1 Tax=Diphasiastrum complanatum TaxID=34168 RepID=A0ACC2DQ44_DIPCM|nr:hypothetical protein O6H91_05G079300 [Diphasiastrum complanatum]
MPTRRTRSSFPKKDMGSSSAKEEDLTPSVDSVSVGPATPAQIQEPPCRTAMANELEQAGGAVIGNQGEGAGIQIENADAVQPGQLQNGGQVDAAQTSRARFLEIARRRAAHFAHFNAEGDEAPAGAGSSKRTKRRRTQAANQQQAEPQPQEDWPGPFSTARRLVEGRAAAAEARKIAGASNLKASLVEWSPSKKPERIISVARTPSSLFAKCLDVLCANMEHVESLQGVPDAIKKVLCARLCGNRKLDYKILRLLVDGAPSTIALPDCSFISEQELTEILAQCCRNSIEVLDLKLCGRGLSDQCVAATLSPSPGMSNLRRLCLKGAYRLTDKGLSTLIESAPQLTCLDISLCSLISEAGIKKVADCLASKLKSLSLEGCAHMNGLKLLPSLTKLQELTQISLGGVGGITDDVLSELLVHIGVKLEELCLSDCLSLTDAAVAAIGACCTGLRVLILDQLTKLTDLSLARIADDCRSLRKMSLQRCKFSYSTWRRGPLEFGELHIGIQGKKTIHLLAGSHKSCDLLINKLNSVRQVGDQTLLALAKHSRGTLEVLDASFCREMTDEALGFLSDACSQLHTLRLFGCTQVTSKFLDGHSNFSLTVIGLTKCRSDSAKILNTSCTCPL